MATFSSNTVVKFAEDPTVVGQVVSKNDGEGLPGGGGKTWPVAGFNLLLNVVKGAYSGLWEDAHHLVVHITEDLTWTVHADTLVKGARQRLDHLRRLGKFRVSGLSTHAPERAS